MSSSSNSNGPARGRSFAPAGAGFTLLEVLIAMFILAMIALGIYQATTETFRLREILTNEGDFYNGIRLSMDILARDFSLVFNPAVIQPPTKKASGTPGAPANPNADAAAFREAQELAGSDAGQLTQFWLPALDKTGIRPSRFVGTAESLTFVSVSHIRIYKDSPESELAKITYELSRDETNRDNPDAKVLVKTESPNVFEEEERKDRFRRTYPILRGIKKLSFQYFRADKGTMEESSAWVTSWDNSKEEFKERLYPDAVRVRFEVVGPTNLSFEGIYVFRTEVPLNGFDPSL